MPLLHRRTDHDVDTRDRAVDSGYRDDRARDDRTLTDRRDVVVEDRRVVDRDAVAPAAVDERTSMTAHDGWNSVVRLVAVLAAAAATVLGAVALFRIDWTDGLDSAATDVAGLSFAPTVAIATVVAGVIALAAAASADRASKLVVGAVLAVVGVAILLIGAADRADLRVERAHGWLALGVGAVLVLSGLLLRRSWTARRRVAADRW